VEVKIKRELRNWAEAEEGEEWSEVEKNVEHKMRKIIKDWAEK
jgi:hypothetical protein